MNKVTHFVKAVFETPHGRKYTRYINVVSYKQFIHDITCTQTEYLETRCLTSFTRRRSGVNAIRLIPSINRCLLNKKHFISCTLTNSQEIYKKGNIT